MNSAPGDQQLVYYLERLEASQGFLHANVDLHDVLTIIDWLEVGKYSTSPSFYVSYSLSLQQGNAVPTKLVLNLEAAAVELENEKKVGLPFDRDPRMQEVFNGIQEVIRLLFFFPSSSLPRSNQCVFLIETQSCWTYDFCGRVPLSSVTLFRWTAIYTSGTVCSFRDLFT